MTTQDVRSVDDLLSGGSPTLKFPEIGTLHKGTVLDATTSQQTDFDTGALLFWDDGRPREQLVLTLQTDQRDPELVNDDGERRLFVKGSMLVAFKGALRAVGARTIERGDEVAVKYARDGEAKKRGLNPPKEYVIQIRRGTGAVADLLADEPTTESAPPVEDLL